MNKFLEEIKSIDYIFNLDKQFEGSCPCFDFKRKIDGFKLTVSGHCWRTDRGKVECPYSGVHLWSDMPLADLKKIGKALGKRLDEADWYGHWEVVYELS